MTTSEIKYKGMGEWSEKTLPFTAENDGILRFHVGAGASGEAYFLVNIGSTSARVNVHQGFREISFAPVKRGDVVSLDATDAADYIIRYMPLYL